MNTSTVLEPLRQRKKTFKAAFICTTVSGVSKYRMGDFAWQMRKFPSVSTILWPFEYKCTIQNPWQVDMLSREDILRTIDRLCDWADVVIWQTLDFGHSFELWQEMKTRHQKPFLMELDDYVLDVPPENEAYGQYRPGANREKIAIDQIKQSDGLIVSTPYLAAQYWGMNDRIAIIPNSIQFHDWRGLETRRHDRLRIGWIGGGTHGKDLEMVAPVIAQLTDEFKDVWFYCIHGAPQVYKTMDKVYWTKKWAPINLYPKFMSSFNFDIGIAPLEDNNFNRGKSNLRWLEYAALKVPCVASPVPDFARTIVSGQNGYLAQDQDEWYSRLRELIVSESLRRDVGRKAYQTVKDQFNVTKTANQYRHLLQEYL